MEWFQFFFHLHGNGVTVKTSNSIPSFFPLGRWGWGGWGWGGTMDNGHNKPFPVALNLIVKARLSAKFLF